MSDRLRGRLLAGGSFLVLIASLAWLFVSQCAAPATTRKPHEALGQALAEQTVKLLNGSGQIVILTMDTKKVPAVRIEVDAFLKSLRHQAGVSLMATDTIKTYDLPRDGLQMDFAGGRYLDLVQRYPGADAIVSFVGVPQLTVKELAQLPARTPKLVAVGRRRKEVRVLFEKRLLDLLIVPRYTFPAPRGEPKTLPQWFEKYFQIVTSPEQLPTHERK